MVEPEWRLPAVLILLFCTTILLPAGSAPATGAATTCAAPVSLVNGDFETPTVTVADAAKGAYVITAQANVPGWQTTATDKKIEIWRQPFNGVYAASGAQHAELNANQVSTLYQDVATTPGQTLRWELKHRGRTGGDTMALLIGAPGATLARQGNYTDGKTAWGSWSGFYTVPGGQTATRFAFESVAAAGGSQSMGNFLDAISFGTSACLVTTTTASRASADVGDVLTYTVTARNDGGNPAQSSVLADDLPPGVDFVPGSIRTISGSSSSTLSDAADSDTGEYDPATRTVRVRAGTGATGSAGGTIPVGESRSFSYQVRITSAAAASTIGNDSTATYTDVLTGNRPTSVSAVANTAVDPAADLSVTAALGAAGVVAGGVASTTLTAANAGPSTATGVQISAVVPAGITGIAATSADGTCAVSGQVATCDVASLAAGATATMTVTGNVGATAPPGLQASLTAAVSSATHEIDQADNATSVSAAVTAVADLAVTMTNTAGVAGAPVTYTATISNQGPSVARGIVLTDAVSSGSTYSSASVPGGACTLTATGMVECTVPDLSPGATAVVTVVLVLDPGGTGAVNNAVSVSAATPDPDSTDNTFSVQSAGTAVADVGVSLALAETSAYAGATVRYTLTVTNHGPSAATNVTFNTVVPPGVTIVRSSPYCTANACTLPYLPAGASIPLSGDAQLGPDAAAGPGRASSTVISPTTDDNPVNDTATVAFTILLRADLSLAQTLTNPADPAALVAGQTVDGTVTVTNAGPTRAEGVVLRQAIPAGRPVPAASTSGGASCAFQGTGVPGGVTADGGTYVCLRPSLAASAVWRVDFTGVLLATGYTGAVYTRTAEVTATTPDPESADNTVTTTRAVERRADLRITETTSTPAVVQTENARFRVTVTNLGPSDAAHVVIRAGVGAGLLLSGGTPSSGTYDTAATEWAPATLTAGDTATLDLDAVVHDTGTLTASAEVVSLTGTDPAGGNDADSAGVTAQAAAPSLSLDNEPAVVPSSSRNGVRPGDRIDYAYAVTNTGNLTMTGLAVTGSRGGTAVCDTATLAPGASASCSAASHTVTQGDIDAGLSITDTARATALTAAAPDPVQFAQVTASVPVAVAAASLTVAVTPVVSPAERAHAAAAGDRIGYTYTVTNNGNVTMTGIALTDTRVGTATCPQASLAVAASMECTIASGARYTVTQSDVDAATPITNAATVSATGYTSAPVSAAVPVVAAAPALTLAVTPVAAAPVRAGDTIGYQYRITNSGNVTISGLAVADSLAGGVTCPSGPLAVGASRDCASTQPYTVTQADVDAGGDVHDDAVVSGQGPAPAALPVAAQAAAPVPVVAAAPALNLTVTADVSPASRNGAAEAGDEVTFGYRLANTGNVTLRAPAVEHPLVAAVSCPAGPVPVGDAITCTAGYRITQDDVDAGGSGSTARALAMAPADTAATVYATRVVTVATVAAAPALTLASSAVVSPAAHQGAVRAGDEISYRYTVVNSGNVTMREVRVVDDDLGEADCPDRTLAAGEGTTCLSRDARRVRQGDVDAGQPVASRAYAYGRAPGVTDDTRFGPAVTTVPVVVAAPSLDVAVTATVTPAAHQHAAAAGDIVDYAYLVTNNGNAAMSGIAVTDAPAGTVTCPGTELAVSGTMTCRAARPYTVTQADVDADRPVSGRAYVTGRPPGAAEPLTFGPFSAGVPVVSGTLRLRLTVTPQVTPAVRRDAVAAGDTVRYRYTVTNVGDVTVTSVVVQERRTGTATCESRTVAVGESMFCRSDAYRVTQADVDAGGRIEIFAQVTGARPGFGRTVPVGRSTAGVRVAAAAPRLTAEQTATRSDDRDVVSAVAVVNTGNVTVAGLTVTGLPAPVLCPRDRIAPGESVVCVSEAYHLTRRHTDDALAGGTALGGPGREVSALAKGVAVVPAIPGSAPVTGGAAGQLFVIGCLMIAAGSLALLFVHLMAIHRSPAGRRACA